MPESEGHRDENIYSSPRVKGSRGARIDPEYIYQKEVLEKLIDNTDKRFNELSDAVDKLLLAFASGSLAFSVTVLKDIAPHSIDSTKNWLLLGWSCLGISLLVSLISTEIALRVSEHRLANYFDHEQAMAMGCKKIKLPKSKLLSVGNGLHISALILLLIGLFSTGIGTIRAMIDAKGTDKAKLEVSALSEASHKKEMIEKKIVSGETKNIGKKIKEGSVSPPDRKPIIPPKENSKENKKG